MDFIIDQFSALSHKELLDDAAGTRLRAQLAPTWVPEAERRRLAAYRVRAAYLSNVARRLLPGKVSDERRRETREYGDASLLVDRLVAGILGSDWSITVDGADVDLEDLELPDRPAATAADDDEIGKRLDDIRARRWEANAHAMLDEWEAALTGQPLARQREAELRAWADREQLPARLDEAERLATGLGDAVIVLWPKNGWPAIQVWDPGFYFPELEGLAEGAFPDTVHLAWEYEETLPSGAAEKRVKRLTWRLVEIAEARSADAPDGRRVWVDDNGLPRLSAPTLPGERVLPDGRIGRPMPWHGPDDSPATTTCLFSSASWRLSDVQAGKVDALSDAAARWEERDTDLGVDFLPVIHIANTTSSSEHFGRSAVDLVAQVLDDIGQNDTRVMEGSAYLGAPVLAMSGAAVPEGDHLLVPGTIFGVGADGRMDALDLSAGIEQLLKLGDLLLDRFWVNGRVPREMIGRVDASNAPSGLALALTFAPFAQVVGAARMIRVPKLELLLRMSQRMAQVWGGANPGPLPAARFNPGNFMPMNRAEVVEMVAAALGAHAMSTQTAVAMLVSVGIPVDDARAEIRRIFAEDTAGAKDVADATGSEALAAQRLGVDLPAAGGGDPEIRLP